MKNLLIVALIGWAGYSAYTLYVEHPAEFAQKKKDWSDLLLHFQKGKAKAEDKLWAERKAHKQHIEAMRDTMLNKQWELSRPYANAVVNCIQQRVAQETPRMKRFAIRTAHPIVGTGNKYETGRMMETALDILSNSFSVCETAKPNTIYVSR